MEHWKVWILRHRIPLLLLILYFIIHFSNLTLLPAYNDESIYLDWGWTETHMPGHLYDSLMDSKQPLMMWLFGFVANFFADPLFAGRLVSVIFGSVTLLGIFKIAKRLYGNNTAIIAGLLYCMIPLFVFYNRQALMESAIACIGIWSFSVLLDLLEKPGINNALKLGILAGTGFFIKTSSLVFLMAAMTIILWQIVSKKNIELIKPLFISLATFFCIDILLFINPVFWQTFPSNSRYTLTLPEYFSLPLITWVDHVLSSLDIAFFFLTPLILLFGIAGIVLMIKHKIKQRYVFCAYFLLTLLIEIITVRSQNQRYMAPFLPFLVITAGYVFSKLWQGDIFKKSIVIASFALPLFSTLFLISNPDGYIMQLSQLSRYSNKDYVRGQMSGYGIPQVMRYIQDHAQPNQPAMVFIALNAGNPENAVDVYAQKDPRLYVLHIDRRFFPDIGQYQCVSSDYPVFFVTRYDQLVGMDQYFTLEKSFLNPDNEYYLGVYTLKQHCTGQTFSISNFYQPAMMEINNTRSGI